MNAFFHGTSGFFDWLWRASWQASVLVILVALVQCVFRNRLSPRWSCAFWLLVVLRLVWPFSVRSPASVFNFVSPGSMPRIAEEAPRGKVDSLPTAFAR